MTVLTNETQKMTSITFLSTHTNLWTYRKCFVKVGGAVQLKYSDLWVQQPWRTCRKIESMMATQCWIYMSILTYRETLRSHYRKSQALPVQRNCHGDRHLPVMPGGVFKNFPLKFWITTSHFSVDSILTERDKDRSATWGQSAPYVTIQNAQKVLLLL